MKILPGVLARRTRTGFNVALRTGTGGDLEYVSSAEILAFRFSSRKTYAILPDRTVQAYRSLSRLKLFLRKHGGWFPIGRGIHLNCNRLVRSQRDPRGGYRLTLEDGTAFNLLPGYEKPILKFLGEKSLLQVSPISKAHALLMKMGLKDLDKDVRDMSVEEAVKHFSTASGSSIILSDLILNFLWQVVQLIRAGFPSPADGGNLRTLWYEIQPLVSKLPHVGSSDPYKIVSDQLARMVKNGICSYLEFKFYDDGRWATGTYNPHVILMAEKEAFFGMILKSIQDLTGVSIIATGGQPSGITSEYFCQKFREVLAQHPEAPPPVVLSIVDYDPFGWALQRTFMRDLAIFGVKVPHPPIHLVLPKYFTPEELAEKYKDLIKEGKTKPSMIRKWMKLTNGVDGKPYGMEAGQFIKNKERATEVFLRLVDPFLVVPAPVPRRFWEEEEQRREKLYQQAAPVFRRCMLSRSQGKKPRKG